MQHDITFTCNNETLSGRLMSHSATEKPGLLLLHGAGTSSKERTQLLSQELLNQGISSFAFDFSGHGSSSGTLEESSLEKRTHEAMAALSLVDTPVNILGSSMGGHIALELLGKTKVKNLILFYPGIYTEAAFSIPFGHGFSEVIRQENSWQDAAVTKNLHTFTGNLLIVIGEDDEVIPKGVIELLDRQAVKAAKKEVLSIPNTGHVLLKKFDEDAELRHHIVQKIINFIS